MNSAVPDFNELIYERDFQFEHAHLIEASAGTGKTYNIQNIYARLIMEKGLRVSQILVVTFTEAATHELRERLLTILRDLQCRFYNQDCNEKDEDKRQERNQHADLLKSCIRVSPEQAKQNIDLALLEFDKHAISTIHGFCQRVLSRYAFETGINFAQEIKNTKKEDLCRLANDWWRNRPADTQIDLSKLKQYIGKLSGKSDYTLAPSAQDDCLKTADQIIREYEKSRKLRRTLNFDDLLRALKEALETKAPGRETLIRELRAEFPAVLVDEFQDTDPVQYQIFHQLFPEGCDNPLFFVGDPKQAIYSFRGGDIYTYLQVKNQQTLELATLKVNFRSTRKMVDVFNKMFRDPPDSAERKTFQHKEIDYIQVGYDLKREEKRKRQVPEAPLQIIQFAADKKLTAALPEIMDRMVKKILEILKWRDCNGKPLFSFRDIAILTNSNGRNREIRQRLQKAGIPASVRNSGNVFASAMARELWAFLLAVGDPSDPRLLKCAQSTVFCNRTGEEEWEKFVEWMRGLNQEWKKHGFPPLVAALETQHYRERLAEREDGEQQLADIGQLWEMCFAKSRQFGNSCEKMTTWLSERINRSAESKNHDTGDINESDVEEYARKLDKDSDAVQIMTMHASKGLEFPIVFLPDCWSLMSPYDKRNQQTPPMYHDENTKKLIVSLSAQEQGKKENKQEKIRLLYVALTRAEQEVVLFTPPWNTYLAEMEPLAQLLNNFLTPPSPSDELYRTTQDAAPLTELRYEPQDDSNDDSKKQWNEAENPPKLQTQIMKGSFSSLFYSGNKKELAEDGRDMDEIDWGHRCEIDRDQPEIFRIPGGAGIGNCWHSILEKIPFDASDEAIRQATVRETNRAFSSGDPKTFREISAQMIRATLRDPLLLSPSGAPFALCDVPWKNRLSEQEFDFSSALAHPTTGEVKKVLENFWRDAPDKQDFLQALPALEEPIPQGFLTGFIDLIFRHENFYYVIDWKSNSLENRVENFSAAGIRREMAKHRYFLQYLLYAVVLHFYLKQTLGKNYSWEKNFGGIRYFFLRGIETKQQEAIYADRPSETMLEALGAVLGLSKPER